MSAIEAMVAALDRFAKSETGARDWYVITEGDGRWSGAMGASTTTENDPTWEVEATGTLPEVLLALVKGAYGWCVNSYTEGDEFFALLLGMTPPGRAPRARG